MPDLLFELGTEEIPATYIPPALEQLKAEATERLKAVGLSYKSLVATGTPQDICRAASSVTAPYLRTWLSRG